MEYRRLGRSGMYVSEIAYGNWITHGSQVAAEEAIKCVRAAFDVGITTFDTADVYAGTKAEYWGAHLKELSASPMNSSPRFIGQLAKVRMIADYHVSTLWNRSTRR
jgi:aryl-alcohol dehydrogenase-like predicted oxidoreductase